jgi:tRNA(Ile)-lysidine synthase
MLQELKNFISDEALFGKETRVLLAVSGGLDSTVMAELFFRAGFNFGMAHCNFQLRADESLRDEQFVREMALQYNVPCFVHCFDTSSFARQNKLSVQMAARELRYTWFEELMSREGYDCLATAHHQDDQIETFLINLSRGTGIAGLHGILPRQGRIIRPMLFATRAELEQYAKEQGIDFVEDSSNTSLKYARNRIRHKIIPQFEKLNPSFRKEMRETIRRVREAESIYLSVVEKEKKRLLIPDKVGYKVPVSELKKLSPGKTWLFELLSNFGFTTSVIEDIYLSLDEQPGKIFFSPTHRAIKDRQYILIEPIDLSDQPAYFQVYPEPAGFLPVELSFNFIVGRGRFITQDLNTARVDFDRLRLPLTIRKWRKGDYFYPLGMKNKKKVSDLFTDLKFSIPQKEQTWLLCSGEEIVWVIGVRLDDRFKIVQETERILEIRFSEKPEADNCISI